MSNYPRCHHSFPDGPAMTSELGNTCGRCGGDRNQALHPCQTIEDDGGEFVPCRRTDTYHAGVGVWLCPIHTNTHRRHG